MSFKILGGERLDKLYYEGIRRNAKSAIERIHEFIKSCEFEEADNILLEIKLELLHMNFEKFIQCNDLLAYFQNDISKDMEDIYTAIKMELMSKQQCNLQKVSTHPTVTPSINVPKFDGNKDNYKAFIDSFKASVDQNTELSTAEKINYLKSSLSGDTLTLVKGVEPKDDTTYNDMLDVLKSKFENENNVPTESKKKEEETVKEHHEELYKNIVHASYMAFGLSPP